MESHDGVEIAAFADAEALESWLAANHARQTGGVWLKIAKKGSGVPSVTSADVLDAVLCYGWIQGQRRSLDDVHYLQKITRRRQKSTWSKVNVRRVEELMAAGRMREPGLAEVAAAQADGRWDAAYESQRNAAVPPDLEAALEQNPRAKAFYEGLGRTDRYMVVLRLLTARTADSRAARLRRMIDSLEAGRKVR